MLNLTEFDIATSQVFRILPRFDYVYFKGYAGDKIQMFEAGREARVSTVLTTTVIRGEEKFLWESCEDLLDRSLQAASLKVRGVFHFDLLNFDVHREIDAFRSDDLAVLIANHSRKLGIAQQSLIKYSSCFGLLKRLSTEDWGKITLHSSVNIFKLQPKKLDLLVKRLSYFPIPEQHHRIIVLNDLSTQPLLDQGDEEQRRRLVKSFGDQWHLFEDIPEVFILDCKNCTELTDAMRE